MGRIENTDGARCGGYCAFRAEAFTLRGIMSGGNQEDNKGLWHQLENTVAFATKQDQIVWAIFGVFGAAQAVLLAALFQNGTAPKDFVGPIVATAGLAISFVWTRTQHRAIEWLNHYEKFMEKLQNELQLRNELQHRFKLPDPEMKVPGEPVRPLMVRCARISGVIWMAVAIFWWLAVLFRAPSNP
jgi:hypothetical protein